MPTSGVEVERQAVVWQPFTVDAVRSAPSLGPLGSVAVIRSLRADYP